MDPDSDYMRRALADYAESRALGLSEHSATLRAAGYLAALTSKRVHSCTILVRQALRNQSQQPIVN